ncbi:MAG: hypothetical protein AAF989_16410 [Planctomycetota bacterium]
MKFVVIVSVFVIGSLLDLGELRADEAPVSNEAWSRVLVPRGEYRDHIKAMPIEQRPGRLLHVYGNSVRYRQQASNGRAGRPLRRIMIGTGQIRSR